MPTRAAGACVSAGFFSRRPESGALSHRSTASAVFSSASASAASRSAFSSLPPGASAAAARESLVTAPLKRKGEFFAER